MMAHVVQDPPPDSPSRSGTYRYYEGFVEKKGPKDKNFDKRWTILEGDKMHFYQNKVGNREITTQKALDTLILDRNASAIPEAKDRCRMNIKCKQGTYKLKATSAEDLEGLWLKVVAVSSAVMPTERDLLPGQKQMFADITIKEKDRKALIGSGGNPGGPASFRRPVQKALSMNSPAPPTPPVVTTRPSPPAAGHWEDSDLYKFYPDHLKSQLPTPPPWFFHKISRDHAEQILLKNPDQGHLLIRVSESHPGEFSLSVRQDMGSIVVKHYRFRWEGRTFKLLIDEQQPELSSMYELIMFFIERSGGNLKPIQTRDPKVLKLPDNLYEHRFHQLTQGTNPENGEAAYRNRLSLQRSNTVNSGRPQESTYLIPDSNAPETNRPNRVSLPASFNQGYNPGGMGGSLAQQSLPEGVAQHDFSPGGVNRGFSSQSLRVQGNNGNGYYKSPEANNGYMIMSAQQRQQLARLDKDPYVNYRDPNEAPDLPIRPLPSVPGVPGGNRKRSISTSALPSGYTPDVANSSFHSQSSNQPSNDPKVRSHSTSSMGNHGKAPQPSLPPRNTNNKVESQPFRARTTSAPSSLGRGIPLHGLANDAQLRSALDRMNLDRQ